MGEFCFTTTKKILLVVMPKILGLKKLIYTTDEIRVMLNVKETMSDFFY